MSTTTPTITAAYVWQCASDFRANPDIADELSITCASESFSVADIQGDMHSMLAGAAMLDNPRIGSQAYGDDKHIVSARGTYRGVYVTVQALVSNDSLDSALAALAGQVPA